MCLHFLNGDQRKSYQWPGFVAHLAERSLQTAEDMGLNPTIFERKKIKKKRPEMAHF